MLPKRTIAAEVKLDRLNPMPDTNSISEFVLVIRKFLADATHEGCVTLSKDVMPNLVILKYHYICLEKEEII